MATHPMRFGIQTRHQLVESPQMLDSGRRATATPISGTPALRPSA
jgi:hypothetical protein